MKSLVLPAALLVAALAPRAAGDSWTAPEPQVAVSEDGKWYVILQPQAGEFSKDTFRLVRVGKSDQPIPRRPDATLEGAPETVEPRPEDTVVAKGECFTPIEVRCRDEGKGFVLFETYAGVGYGISVAAWDEKGQPTWEKRLGDLFTPAEIEAFSHTTSSIWWYLGQWIDEAADDLVVLARGGDTPQILRIALADGAVRPGKPEDLVLRVGKGDAEGQITALDAALRLGARGLAAAAKKNLGRADVPLAVRLRLAVALARDGDTAGKDLLLVSAQAGTEPRARAFAVEHLPDVLGPAAIPVLRDVLREGDDAWGETINAFVALGATAVPALQEMLAEAGERPNYRGAAIDALGRIGPHARPAVPALLSVVKEANPYLSRIAIDAVAALEGPEGIEPTLLALLEKGSEIDDLAAGFFEDHPSRAAVPGLIAALARHERDPNDLAKEPILAALVESSGDSLVAGTSAAWRAWWAEHQHDR